ncbi:FAD-linked oxidase [Thiomicrorhabdus immobilis]|uniref:FAD-linked oxidase n=1 Tax=Thiomicrorhabdus immobilis TaxID=2791037 RepID=A0ABM7MEQ1_9GAMM|nr:FAD-binding oxidoreductase [Thiomicrorhabdus immobilis]BCN93921.1 FAD-linked oxidase [Thiomicrorhabdus immobilis]
MKLSGWGRYPIIQTENAYPNQPGLVSSLVSVATDQPKTTTQIARGLGRSYGDSSLAEKSINLSKLDHFIEFDEQSGQLTCSAGVSFAEILRFFVPKGWFLPVTPGTQFVTVGGAIASDVHGKNHHIDGAFCEHVNALELCLASGEVVECSKIHHPHLFRATCGGMGLTGIILQATFTLKRIETAFIQETTYKTANLAETLAKFEEHDAATYSVAWIDCLATGANLGRSLLMLGEHASEEEVKSHPSATETLQAGKTSKLNMPFDLPAFTLNSFSVKAFNALYYGKARQAQSQRLVHYAPFFYPLDSIQNWNRMYGKNGFAQYQFVIPKSAGLVGLTEILTEIANSKRGSFLAVLKVFGQGNDNYLSFPEEGYTLALDFKMDSTLFEFLNKLDAIVLHYGGKLYLTKDARMSEQMFKQSYPQWQEFQKIRHQYGAHQAFNSLQSTRLGL